MLNNIHQHAIVSYPYCRCPRVLQLYNILLILINLSLIYLSYLILIPPAKRLAYLNSANAYSSVTISLCI
jgi:hypothetical protein